MVFELERKMGEKDKELTEIKDRQEQFAKTEEEQEKRLAEYAKQLKDNPKLGEDEAFVAEMIKDSIKGSKMYMVDKETQANLDREEKPMKQRVMELEKLVELLLKEKNGSA